MRSKQPPFVIGVLADLSGEPRQPLARFKDRQFIPVRKSSLSRLFRHLQPSLQFSSPFPNAPEQKFTITFCKNSDFTVKGIKNQLRLQGFTAEVTGILTGFILADKRFAALSASWEGLRLLAGALENTRNFSVKVLNVSKREITKDSQRAADFYQTALYRKVFSEALGTFGGEPIRCLLGDFDLGSGPEDAELADRLACIAAASRAPMICGAETDFFVVNEWIAKAWYPGNRVQAFRPEDPSGALMETDETGFLFPVSPRFRVQGVKLAKKFGSLEVRWLHPVYLIGSAILNRFMSPVEYHCHSNNKVARTGLNSLVGMELTRDHILNRLRPLRIVNTPQPGLNLGDLFILCEIYVEMYAHLRTKKPVNSSRQLRTLLADLLGPFLKDKIFISFDIQIFPGRVAVLLVWNRDLHDSCPPSTLNLATI